VIASSLLCALLAILWLLDSLRLRGRVKALVTLPVFATTEPLAADASMPSDYRVILRQGVVLDKAVARAAMAYAREHQLRALDLVASDLEAWRALLLVQAVDIARFRTTRLAAGRSAGDAMVVATASWDALLPEDREPASPLAMTRLARTLKLRACTAFDFVVVPPFTTSASTRESDRADLVEYVFGEFSFGIVLMQNMLVFSSCFVAPKFALAALMALHAQLLIATSSTLLLPRGRWLQAITRSLSDTTMALTALVTRLFRASDDANARRDIYRDLLADGTSRFFEPRRDTCPICGGTALASSISTVDRYGFKPGDFTLETCAGCHHFFQNPRLSIEGLDFYYRDFYDGLGEGMLDTLFTFDTRSYEERARIVTGFVTPRRWLDVGGGHGHFCCIARETWKGAKFDGLDLSESIDEAERRGWTDRSFRGLFPEVAGEIGAGEKYDVVSMSHYLEHTRDPRAEIEAANAVLETGGLLMIEVPDPESRLGKIFGSYWVPWFQPQHQHLVSASNLLALLRESRFEPLVWHRGEAHQKSDLTLFAVTLLNRIAPPPDLPWRPKSTPFARAWRQLVWCPGLILVGFFWVIDQLVAPLLQREGWSNTYRVLARRTS